MKDFDRFITRFRQFGGMRLVWQYAKMGVLWIGIKEIVKCALKGRSFKSVYPVITERIDRILVERYGDIKAETKTDDRSSEIRENRIWFCWLQGIENASEMVKVCLESQMRIFGDRVVVLDHGTKIAEGTPEEIANNDRVIESYLGSAYKKAK